MTKPKLKTIKAAAAVLDHGLYPRHHIDATHVLHIRQAYRADEALPAPILDADSLRVIDGWHRITATLKEYGEDAEVAVELREYDSEADMLFDAMLLNSGHGSNLTPYDRVRCLTLADEFKLDMERVAKALRTTPEELGKLRVTRTAKTGSTITPIKHGLGHLAGRRLTKRQAAGNESYGGMRPVYFVNQVISMIENDLLPPDDPALMERLDHLRGLLAGVETAAAQEA